VEHVGTIFQTLVYWGSAKNRYQIEVPESAVKNVPNEYRLMSSKKGAKRFRTTAIEDMLVELSDAEDRKDVALKDVMRRIFYNFDKQWVQLVISYNFVSQYIFISQKNAAIDIYLIPLSPKTFLFQNYDLLKGKLTKASVLKETLWDTLTVMMS